MGNKYLEKYSKTYQRNIAFMKEDIEDAEKNGLPINAHSFYSSMSLMLKSLAIGSYIIDDDVNVMKERFVNAAYSTAKKIQFCEDNKIIDSSYLSMNNFHAIEWALIGNNVDLALVLAKMIGGRGDLDSLNIGQLTYNLGYAIKYVVEGEYSKAIPHIELLREEKDPNYVTRYESVLNGIVNGSEVEIIDGLNNMLKAYKKSKQFKNSPEEFLCIPVISMAKLAQLNGYKVDIDDKLSPAIILKDIKIVELKYDIFK